MTTPVGRGDPQLVFAPARPRAGGGHRDVVFEMREQPDGRRVLPVFSSVTRLVEALGHYQPWACVPLWRIRATFTNSQMAQVLLDPPVDPLAWRWAEGSLVRFAEDQEYELREEPR
jgi:type III secretion system (T3SS) SseB-like protein